MPEYWRTRFQRDRLLIEVCGECGGKNIGRDICPHCGARIVSEGENIFKALSEGREPKINGELKICVSQYGVSKEKEL